MINHPSRGPKGQPAPGGGRQEPARRERATWINGAIQKALTKIQA